MEIFPNWTVIPIVLFLIVLTYVLNRTFFLPLGKTLEERHQRIEGAHREAEEIRKASQDRQSELERRMREARRESDQIIAQMKNEALAQRTSMISAKREEAGKMLTEAKNDIRSKADEARKELLQQSESFAYRIASQILRRSVQGKKSTPA